MRFSQRKAGIQMQKGMLFLLFPWDSTDSSVESIARGFALAVAGVCSVVSIHAESSTDSDFLSSPELLFPL